MYCVLVIDQATFKLVRTPPRQLLKPLIPLRAVACLLAALGIFPLAAFIKWVPVVKWLPDAGREWVISALVLVLVCALLARRAGDGVDRLLGRMRQAVLAPTPRDFAIYIGLFTFFASLFVAWFSFGGQPVGGDEMTQRFQARLLLAGRLYGVAEQPFEFFGGIQTANVDGRWFSQFPIGGAALLAVGVLFGMPWIVNPLLAGWTAVSVYRFAARITDEATGRFAAILFASSPFVLLMSGSQMNHVGALAFLMLGLVGLADWFAAADARAQRNAALKIGFGFAASAAIRPYEATLFAIVVGVMQLWGLRESPARARSLAWQLLGGAVPTALLLFANAQQTGHPLLFGYDVLNGVLHRPGFHPDPTGVNFGPIEGLHHVSAYLLLLNVSLFHGPVPALLFVVAALALIPRATRWDYLIAALIVALLVAYGTYWAESFFVGPRFLFAGVPFFMMIAARLPAALAARMRTPASARFARLLLPASVVMAWLIPPGVTSWQGAWSAFAGERASNINERIDIDRAAREAGLQDALVIVHEGWHGRLAARLRAMGAPALTAESFLREMDACGLHVGLDTEERIGGKPSIGRVNRVVARSWMAGEAKLLAGTTGSTSLAFAPNRAIHPYCLFEMQVDTAGTASLDRFLAHARFDRNGRLAGNVVYARDFGPKNRELLTRFGDRTWYRYRPRKGRDDTSPIFEPYIR